MVVKGHGILHNCPICYASGLSVKLKEKGGGRLVCEYDDGHVFIVENGLLRRVKDDGG